MYKSFVVLLAIIFVAYAQRARTTFTAPRYTPPVSPQFVPVTTPPADFHTGGAFGQGDRIPMPHKWNKPSHQFTPGIKDHRNGFFTETDQKGQTSHYLHMPGQAGSATCMSPGGCDK